MSAIELWGGFECTIARIGHDWRDQCAETGHTGRLSDLDMAAELGFSRLRYPVLWETVAPNDPDERDWSRPDVQLRHLKRLGLPVIAGLVHHGSGPQYTHLLDAEFPALLARYAEALAQRYPWIDAFTPVNEPLTTARFSGLYGHWYPHGRDLSTFLAALVTQCKGVVLAMEAIRRITPHARLIQTEDLGRVFSTPRLAYQAEHENERRWLSFDLLTGRVTREHPWYSVMIAHGIAERDLGFLAEARTPPDVIGINHYLTSDRYLDEDLAAYPACHHGGNGRDAYADAAAVRCPVPASDLGFEARMREAWERYHMPLAMTEVHNGSTREEQLRWLSEAWHGARGLERRGVDVRAVTVWALAGGCDWPSLLTRREGLYEPGVLDVRTAPGHRTALAKAVRKLAAYGTFSHHVTTSPGWWQRPNRFHRDGASKLHVGTRSTARPILIAGANGTLGRALARHCSERGLHHVALARGDMDIADAAHVRRAILALKPWAIINAAGFVRPADAARERPQCMRDNSHGPAILSDVAASEDLPLVTFSSDLVFDGADGFPYGESHAPSPRCVYGESKAIADLIVHKTHPKALIVRTSAFFSASDTGNYAHAVLASLKDGRTFDACGATVVSPTFVPDLVREVLNLLIDDATGIWHLANQGSMSWHAFARAVAGQAKLDVDLIQVVPAVRPRNTSLRSERGDLLPPLDEAIERYVRAIEL